MSIILDSGTYTPTSNDLYNLSSVTPKQAQFLQVGSTVTVSGTCDVDPTATGYCAFALTLPVASNLGAFEDLAGSGSSLEGLTSIPAVAIYGRQADNKANFSWIAGATTAASIPYTFTYQVI